MLGPTAARLAVEEGVANARTNGRQIMELRESLIGFRWLYAFCNASSDAPAQVMYSVTDLRAGSAYAINGSSQVIRQQAYS